MNYVFLTTMPLIVPVGQKERKKERKKGTGIEKEESRIFPII